MKNSIQQIFLSTHNKYLLLKSESVKSASVHINLNKPVHT